MGEIIGTPLPIRILFVFQPFQPHESSYWTWEVEEIEIGICRASRIQSSFLLGIASVWGMYICKRNSNKIFQYIYSKCQVLNQGNLSLYLSFCIFSYNITTRQMKLVHNGNMEVNYTRPHPTNLNTFDDVIPLDWFSPYDAIGQRVHYIFCFKLFKL